MIKNRIFIIDDDPFWTASLTAQLKAQNHNSIHSFGSGAAALEQLHLNPYLVFLDYQMAEMDGLEVLKAIKAYYPGISVVFCTALEDLGVAIQALDGGSFEYLLKTNLAPQPLEAILHKAGEHFFQTITQ